MQPPHLLSLCVFLLRKTCKETVPRLLSLASRCPPGRGPSPRAAVTFQGCPCGTSRATRSAEAEGGCPEKAHGGFLGRSLALSAQRTNFHTGLAEEGSLKQSHFLTAFSPIAQNQPSRSVAHWILSELVAHSRTAQFGKSLASPGRAGGWPRGLGCLGALGKAALLSRIRAEEAWEKAAPSPSLSSKGRLCPCTSVGTAVGPRHLPREGQHEKRSCGEQMEKLFSKTETHRYNFSRNPTYLRAVFLKKQDQRSSPRLVLVALSVAVGRWAGGSVGKRCREQPQPRAAFTPATCPGPS